MRGTQVIRIVDAYVAGINAQYRKAGLPLTPWTRNDVVAVGGLMGAVFGAGGGDEVRRSQFLDLLQRKLGGENGRQVWEDLRQRDDPEANVAVPGRFGYGSHSSTEIGNVVVDAASFEPAGRSDATTTQLPMSNALLVGAKRSVSGKPLFVAGAQVGQYYPQIMLELDLDGGGFRARGAAFPGISFGILLGRGIDYAWSATSAGSDLVDEYVETLCGGSDTMYLYRGECRAMTTFDAGTIVGGPGEPDRPLVFHETVHGPVKGYATVDGKRVAISRKRSTRGRELASLRFFLDLSTNRVRSARDFVRTASEMELTFNWVYADSRNIAQFTSGRLPLRPASVDPGLPTKGTGEYEWQGFAPASAHAQVIDPSTGVILNWNNKPARGYAGADDEWTWGPVQRVDLLWAGIQRRKKHTLASVVAAMNGAATQDLRLMRVWPVVREVLARGTGRLAPRRRPPGSTRGTRPVAAGSTRTSTARSTRPALPSSTPRGAGSQTPSSARCSTRRRAPSSRSSCPTTRRSRPMARARTAAGGRTSRRTCGLCWRDPSQVRSRRGSAAAATSRSARRRCGRPSTRRPPGSRRHRGRIRPRGAQTPRRSGSGSHPGSSRGRCAARTSRRSSRRSRSPRTGRARGAASPVGVGRARTWPR